MKNAIRKARTDENGYIVVETIGAFIPFVLLVVSILSLVNITAVQARVHYALTQAANTVSMYSYTLQALGLADDLAAISGNAEQISKKANAVRDDINSVIEGLESLSDVRGSVDGAGKAVDDVTGWVGEAADDPKAMLQLFMNYGVNEVKNLAFEQLTRPLIGRYLINGDISGDEYLNGAGVVNSSTGSTGLNALEFYQFGNLGRGNNVLIDKNGNIKITVEYEIVYTFAGLPLPFRPTLKITQTVVTKAWLNGSGEGYQR